MARHQTEFFAVMFSRLSGGNLVKDTLSAKSEGLTLCSPGNSSWYRGCLHSCFLLTLQHSWLAFHMSLLMKGLRDIWPQATPLVPPVPGSFTPTWKNMWHLWPCVNTQGSPYIQMMLLGHHRIYKTATFEPFMCLLFKITKQKWLVLAFFT